MGDPSVSFVCHGKLGNVVPIASQSLAWTTIRLFSEQESSQHRKATTSLGWAVTMCTGPPATLYCKKQSNIKLAASRWRVDSLYTLAFVNWANRCSMADSSMHKAVSLSFEPFVFGATHHWQMWNVSLFSPWHFEHRTLPWKSDTRISVHEGVLVAGIPRTRRDHTASTTGRMEHTSRSRFRRACRT